jgi:hypothetical protein
MPISLHISLFSSIVGRGFIFHFIVSFPPFNHMSLRSVTVEKTQVKHVEDALGRLQGPRF